ncbi:DNA-3-methyladenine glycosylase [bacterium]|nr:DNA-3-methyladenine glycosylase [bacterium]
MRKRLKRDFFTQPTLKLANDLLGKFIVRNWRCKKIVGEIVEVEVYKGPKDRASHSFGGKITKRNRIVYKEGGYIYIYLCYGMHWQLNIVSFLKGKPECILLRALEPKINNLHKKTNENFTNRKSYTLKFPGAHGKLVDVYNLANGPGKLCKYLKLNKSFYGEDLTRSKRIWLEDRGVRIKSSNIIAAKRVGIDYAGYYWSRRKWRFYIKNNPFVSFPRLTSKS